MSEHFLNTMLGIPSGLGALKGLSFVIALRSCSSDIQWLKKLSGCLDVFH
jgi:hypothetical protein